MSVLRPDFLQFDASKTLMGTLGIEATEFSRECIKMTVTIDERHMQPFGLMHGGVSGVMAESISSGGSLLFIDPAHQSIVGLELNMNHIRAVKKGEVVTGIGIPLHVGRRTLVWDIKLYNEQDKLVCTSRCTVSIIDQPLIITQK
jgi:uncharacterized protein (TIGR00369 family)